MKILYISKFDLPDFMNDMVFHGLRSLLGEEVVDFNEAWYMYDDFRKYWADRVPGRGMEYGRGFTLYGKLPKLSIDRTDIPLKIQKHYFDKIIYGSMNRCFECWGTISEVYKPQDIIFIDGEDNDYINTFVAKQGMLFKREMNYIHPEYKNYVNPLNFCIPKELIVKEVPKKENITLQSFQAINRLTFIPKKSLIMKITKNLILV